MQIGSLEAIAAQIDEEEKIIETGCFKIESEKSRGDVGKVWRVVRIPFYKSGVANRTIIVQSKKSNGACWFNFDGGYHSTRVSFA